MYQDLQKTDLMSKSALIQIDHNLHKLTIDITALPETSFFFLRMAAFGCQVAITLLRRDYATDAVSLYQSTGTHFADLGRMTG